MTELIARAARFAAQAHEGQSRKYTDEPYFNHVAEVASIVNAVPGATEEMVAAAYLHDVIEDCGVSQSQLDELFGETVGTYVMWLTDNEVGNRASRKAQACARLGAAPAEVQTIKLADLISNTSSIRQHDPGFAPVYLAEARALLAFLTKGDSNLHRRATKCISN